MAYLMKPLSLALLLSTLLTPLPALAVDNDALMSRVERMEKDFNLLQRQVARGEPVRSENGDATSSAVAPQMEVRLSTIEEEMRSLRGKLEEAQFQNKRLADTFEKYQKDTEFRFNELSQAKPGVIDTSSETVAPVKPADTAAGDERKPIPAAKDTKEAPKDDAKATEKPPTFASAREHYDYAFRLLNQTKYEEAAASFKAFTKKYPKDPLVGHAHYWLGETFYTRHDYVNAADGFRQGFEAAPGGPKAPDNLLKLAMSLGQLKRDKEACVVLGQIVSKFGQTSPNIAAKAGAEQKRISCP